MPLHEYTIHPSDLPTLRNIQAENQNRKIHQRAQVLLMLHAGHTPANIAFDLAIPEVTILDWWSRWEKDGIAWLLDDLVPERSARPSVPDKP